MIRKTFVFIIVLILTFNLLSKKENFKNPENDTVEVIEVIGNVPAEKAVQTTAVWDKIRINEFNLPDLKSILSLTPGILTLSNGFFGQSSSTFIRGSWNSRMLVIVDGIKVRDGSTINGPDFSSFPSYLIKKVEIVRGPLSSLYGSDAMGGAVSITTMTQEGVNAEFSAGSHGSYMINAAVGKQFGNFSFSLSSSLKNYSEKVPNSRFSNRGFNGKIYYRDGLKTEGGLNINYQLQNSGIPFNSYGVASPSRKYDSYSFFAGFPLNFKVGKNTSVVSNISYQKHKYSFEDTDDIWSPYYSNRSGNFESDLKINTQLNNKVKVVTGIDYSHSKISSENSSGVLIDNISDNYFSAYSSFFVDLNKVFMTTAVRYDKYNGVKYKISPQAGISFFPFEKFKVRISYSEGFKAPLLLQKINPWGLQNLKLKPETARSFEIGFDLNLSKNIFNIAVFNTNYLNLIDWVTVNPMTWQGQYQNISKAKIRGIEAGLTSLLVKNIIFGFSYTFLNSKDSLTGLPLKRRPKNSWNFTVSYTNTLFNLNLKTRYVGKRPDYDFLSYPPDVENIPFNTYDLSLNIPLKRKIVIFGRITNLFNEHYQEIYGYYSAGRRFEIGIRYR